MLDANGILYAHTVALLSKNQQKNDDKLCIWFKISPKTFRFWYRTMCTMYLYSTYRQKKVTWNARIWFHFKLSIYYNICMVSVFCFGFDFWLLLFLFSVVLSMHWEHCVYIQLRAREFLFPAHLKIKHANNVSNTCMLIHMKVFSLALVFMTLYLWCFFFFYILLCCVINSLALWFEIILDHTYTI